MRILYISSSIIPFRSANSIQVMKMCNASAKMGHDVELVHRKSDLQVDDIYAFYAVEPGFRLIALNWPRIRIGGVVYGWNVYRYLSGRTYDLVYGRCVYGLLAAATRGLPCVFEVHAPPENRARQIVEALLLRHSACKRLVLITRALRDEYLRLFPWLERRVELVVAHDGADPLPESIHLEVPAAFRQASERLRVGYVGSLYPGKGAEVVVRLAEHLPDMEFHLIGGTPDEVAYWKARSASSNLTFHGFMAPAQAALIQRFFDVLLLPPGKKVEAFGGGGDIRPWMSPLKMFEYMAAGVPIVASDLPVLKEVLRDGENSLLVPLDRIEEWVAALRRLQQDRQLARRLAERALVDFMGNYTWEKRAEKVLTV